MRASPTVPKGAHAVADGEIAPLGDSQVGLGQGRPAADGAAPVAAALPPGVADPVAALLQRLHDAPRRRTVVGLVGLPGAGKSTLAHHLCHAVNHAVGEDVAVVLGMDGFHLTRAQLRAFPDPAAALARRGAPWTFDPRALAQRLREVRQADLAPHAAPVPWPGFEHGVGDPVPDALHVPPGVRLVLLEGLYLLHNDHGWDLQGLMDTCWFLDTPLEVALQRLSARHQAAWGITPEAAEARIAANDGLNAQIVLQGRCRADGRVADVPMDATAAAR
jgi:pantothenate kinase